MESTKPKQECPHRKITQNCLCVDTSQLVVEQRKISVNDRKLSNDGRHLFIDSQKESGSTAGRKVSVSQRKISVDLRRKLSTLSTSSDVSYLSCQMGVEEDDLKSMVQEILDMENCLDWELDSQQDEDEYDREEFFEMENTVESNPVRKSSGGSNASEDSLDAAEDFTPIEISVDEVKSVLSRYHRHRMTIRGCFKNLDTSIRCIRIGK